MVCATIYFFKEIIFFAVNEAVLRTELRTCFNSKICVFQTFDECVAAGGSDCAPEKLWLQIPFFCGHYSECW